MKRYWCLLTAAGMGLLAAFCWLGDATPIVAEVESLLKWNTAATAFAAPPRRGQVVRRMPVDTKDIDLEEAGFVASDRGAPRPTPVPLQPAPRTSAPRSGAAPRASSFDELESDESDDLDTGLSEALPDDEPAELVAGRPLPSASESMRDEKPVSRRRGPQSVGDPVPTVTHTLEPTLIAPADMPVETPTLAEPDDDVEMTSKQGARPAELPVILDPDATMVPAPRYAPRPQNSRRSPSSSTSETQPIAVAPSKTYEVPRELPAHAKDVEPSPFDVVPEKQEPTLAPAPAAAAMEPKPESRIEPRPEPRPEPSLWNDNDSRLSPAPQQELQDSAASPFERDATNETPETANVAEPSRGVMLRWETPGEIQVNLETECRLMVENTTNETLANVLVEAQLPAGLALARTEPVSNVGQTKLAWKLASLAAHEQRTIQLWVIPNGEGEVEPSATVTFSHASAAKLQVIHPQLKLDATGPASTLAGQPAGVRFVVSNPGSGKARNVVVEVRLDPRLQNAAGSQLRYALGSLGAGESREVQVALNPTEAGRFEVLAAAMAKPGLSGKSRYELEVVKPTLVVAVEGPRLRYVDRQATYSIKVHNPGPAPADNVQVFDAVPAGFRFVEASAGGTFDSNARQVAWFVGRLEPNQTTEVNVQLMPTEPGEQRIEAAVKADAGVSETASAVTRVEGVASVALDVVDADDPIEVAGETTYEIRLTNRGTQPARQVQAAAKLPSELEALEVTGPTPGKIQGQQVVFDAIESLGPGQTEVFRVRVRCRREGQVTFRAYYRDAEHPNPVIEEEVTRIYQD